MSNEEKEEPKKPESTQPKPESPPPKPESPPAKPEPPDIRLIKEGERKPQKESEND